MSEVVVQKGAFIIEKMEDDDSNNKNSNPPPIIEFQFNPESLKRTLRIVSTREPPGQLGGGGAGGDRRGVAGMGQASNRPVDPRDLKNDSSLGESISITAHFDGKENYPFKGDLLPVLSFLEKMMEPVETKKSKASAAHVNPPKVLPLVFFCWGEKRILPVKITQLSINETEFAPNLNPIRAEVSIEMELIIPLKDSNNKIISAHKYIVDKKDKAAKRYTENAKNISKAK